MTIKIGKVKKQTALPVNLNGDIAHVEKTRLIQQQQQINQPSTTEMVSPNNIREVIENLDRDEKDPKSNLTTIDFNTRLTRSEIGGIVALQMLNTLQVGGSACSLIARSVKRHNVSLNGLGRQEKVQIIQGERDHESSGKTDTLFGKLKGYMGGNNEKTN